MRALTVIAMITLVALAGCADSGTTPSPTDGVDGQEPADTNTTADAPGVNNTAPVAVLVADAINGTSPLAVNLTLDGSDADGDNLTWTLTLNGTQFANGTTLPAAVNLTLAAGNHTVVLTVFDGELTGTTDLTIAVLEGVSVPTGPEPLFKKLHMIEGCELCVDGDNPATGAPGAAGCIGWQLGDNELDCGWMVIPAEYQGTPYSAFSYTDGTLPLLGTDGNVDLEFYESCDHDAALIERNWSNSFGEAETGIIPAGAGCIVGFEFSWPNLGHTIEFSLGAIIH